MDVKSKGSTVHICKLFETRNFLILTLKVLNFSIKKFHKMVCALRCEFDNFTRKMWRFSVLPIESIIFYLFMLLVFFITCHITLQERRLFWSGGGGQRLRGQVQVPSVHCVGPLPCNGRHARTPHAGANFSHIFTRLFFVKFGHNLFLFFYFIFILYCTQAIFGSMWSTV